MYSRPTPCVVATPLSVGVLLSLDSHGNNADVPPAEAGAATATPVPIGAAESKDVRAVVVDARFRSHLLVYGLVKRRAHGRETRSLRMRAVAKLRATTTTLTATAQRTRATTTLTPSRHQWTRCQTMQRRWRR